MTLMNVFICPGKAVLNASVIKESMLIFMNFCSLLANNLVMIFKVQLSKEMGLKSPGVMAASFLGIKVMKD